MPNEDLELNIEGALKNWGKGPYMTFLRPSADILVNEAKIGTGDFVLDVGAGFGDPALELSDRVGSEGKIIGIDHDPESMSIAENRAKLGKLENIEFKVMEIPQLMFPDATFDAVISRNVIIYFDDPSEFLSEQYRVLKDDGRVAVAVWGSNANNPFMNLPMQVLRKHLPKKPQETLRAQPVSNGAPQRANTSDPNVLEKLLENSKFKSVSSGKVELKFLGNSNDAEIYWNQRLIGSPASQKILLQMDTNSRKLAIQDALQTIRDLIDKGSAYGEVVWASGTKA
jgi:ubiquinone/menaquinone biosynthesis C-methylase UbiE